MNPSSDSEIPSAETHRPDGLPTPHRSPANWREALLLLISSRVDLIELESKDFTKDAIRKISRLVAALFCGIFSWALLLAGGIALISRETHWPWSWVTLAVGGLHLLACLIFAMGARSSGAPAFPVTRSEFKKDREWIENLNTTRKSKG